MMVARKSTRQFNKDRKAFYDRCLAENAPCWLCGMPIDYSLAPGSGDDAITLDHEFPVSLRPDLQFDPAGFRPAHNLCNILRGNKDPEASLGTLTRKWI